MEIETKSGYTMIVGKIHAKKPGKGQSADKKMVVNVGYTRFNKATNQSEYVNEWISFWNNPNNMLKDKIAIVEDGSYIVAVLKRKPTDVSCVNFLADDGIITISKGTKDEFNLFVGNIYKRLDKEDSCEIVLKIKDNWHKLVYGDSAAQPGLNSKVKQYVQKYEGGKFAFVCGRQMPIEKPNAFEYRGFKAEVYKGASEKVLETRAPETAVPNTAASKNEVMVNIGMYKNTPRPLSDFSTEKGTADYKWLSAVVRCFVPETEAEASVLSAILLYMGVNAA